MSTRANKGAPATKYGGDGYFYSLAVGCYEDDYYTCLAAEDDKGPSLAEAKASPDWPLWDRAIQEEVQSLHINNTFTEVPLTEVPRGIRPLSSKFVVKEKYNATGQFERHKARLVVRGFAQTEGIDYTETFSPTSKYTTVRTLLSKAAAEDLEMCTIDIKTAFLNGDLEEEIYVQYPLGYQGKEGCCWRLNKALYGLKQAPRAWHTKLDTTLRSLGYTPSLADPALYTRTCGNARIYLVVYVDDIILASNSCRHGG